jgi:hypothetical protein
MIDTTSRNQQTATRQETATRHERTLRRAWPPMAGAAAVAMTVAACSSLGGGGSTSSSTPPAPTAAPSSSDGSFTSRVKSLFSGSSGSLNSSAELACPSVEYRQGAATWSMNGPAVENSAMSLRYQASFLQTARECIVNGGNMTFKVGVQGRVVVGPAGSPGTIHVPLRYALVREGLQPKTLWTKLFTIPVSIPAGELNLPWLHVQEEMTVPRPSAQELEAYVIYIGFDPQGASSAPKPAAKPKTARAR